MLVEYLKKRLAEKSTYAAIVAAIVGFIAKYTGISGEMLTATEEIVGGAVLLAIAALPSPKLAKDKVQSALSAGIAAMLLILLSACGGNANMFGGYLVDFDNPQNRAGLNTTTLVWGKVENAEGSQEYQLKYLNLVNGQESGKLTLELALSDGTIYKFRGGDIRAFEAFQTRAEVEKVIAEKLGDAATPELIGALANLFAPGAVP